MAVNRVEVTINSRQYAVLADESEEYLRKLAGHIDEKVKLILKGGHNILGERPLVLAALNICDEYYKCEEAGRVLQSQLSLCTDKLNRANAEIKTLMDAMHAAGAAQMSFEEKEAEEKLQKAEDELHKTEGELQRAEDRIRSLEARISELERKSGNSGGNGGNSGNGGYNRNNYGKRN